MRHDDPRSTSWATSDASRRSMIGNRRRDTVPELKIRRRLHALGLRYRVDYAPTSNKRRRADIVFTRRRIAIFIDGCFWHGCPEHGTSPKGNAQYWGPKLRRNIERDRDTTAELQADGWTVLRYWEHEDAALVASDIVATVTRGLRPEAR